ncbi:MAG: hypothetical protein ACYCYP_08030 [Leptospirales bacterium]
MTDKQDIPYNRTGSDPLDVPPLFVSLALKAILWFKDAQFSSLVNILLDLECVV